MDISSNASAASEPKLDLEQRRASEADPLRDLIASGLEQLRRGEGLDGEAVFAELLAPLEEQR